MKKIYLFILFAVVALGMKARPAITLTAQVDGNERNLVFALSEPDMKLQIDWGDGNLVETEVIKALATGEMTTVTGTPVGEGNIKIYGDHIVYFDASSRVDGAQITSLDVSNAPELQQLYVYTNSLTSLDLSKNVNLVRLDCYNNPITELDLSANTALTRMDIKNMSLTSIDLSHNTALTTVTLSDNALSSIDLSANTALTTLYALNCGLTSIDLSHNTALTYLSLNNNQLTSLDVTSLPALEYLYCMGNELTELKADNVTKTANCSNNNLDLATLPVLNAKNYIYVPQKAMSIPSTVAVGGTIDLSSQNNIQGLADAPRSTVYTWKTTVGDNTLEEGVDYTEEAGVFTFLKAQETPIYCQMTTAAFPKFTGTNAFKTTEISVVETVQPAITLTAQVDGNERNLVFILSEPDMKLQIDWGDGNLVETEVIKALASEEMTTVTGTPVGEGNIKIYGDHIVYFDASSRVDGAQITSLDVSNAPELQQLYVYTNSLTSLDLSKNVNLVRLECYNNPITELDLSANTALTRMDIKNMSLTSIDLSHNTALTTVTLSDNALSSIDLSANTALATLYALNCGLTSIDLSHNTALTYVSLNNNQLTSLDVTSLPALGYLYCSGNELTELKVDNVTKTANCSNNNLDLATLPVLNAKNYIYVPQKAMRIPSTVAVGGTIDLSSQNNIQGLADAPRSTVYTWKTTVGDDTLEEGVDYTEEAGVFTFLKAQETPIYCLMTTAAFPKFTGTNAFKTTEVRVETGTGIAETGTTSAKVLGMDGAVKVIGLAEGDEVTVYNVAGIKTAAVRANGAVVELPLSSGIYMVSVNGKAHKVLVK